MSGRSGGVGRLGRRGREVVRTRERIWAFGMGFEYDAWG